MNPDTVMSFYKHSNFKTFAAVEPCKIERAIHWRVYMFGLPLLETPISAMHSNTKTLTKAS